MLSRLITFFQITCVLAPCLTGCYSIRLFDLGPGSKVVAVRPGPHEIYVVQAPTQAAPSAVFGVHRLTEQEVRSGTASFLLMRKNKPMLIGSGALVQWFTTIMAVRGDKGFAAAGRGPRRR